MRLLIYRRESKWLRKILQRTGQQPLSLLKAGLLDATAECPSLVWPSPAATTTTPSATAHWVLSPLCHYGKTSDLKQTHCEMRQAGPWSSQEGFLSKASCSKSVSINKQKSVVAGSTPKFSCKNCNMNDIGPHWLWWESAPPPAYLFKSREHESNLNAQIVQFGANLNDKSNINYKLQKRYCWPRWYS